MDNLDQCLTDFADQIRALQTELTRDYDVPSILETVSLLRVFSFGGGVRGVQMMNHSEARPPQRSNAMAMSP